MPLRQSVELGLSVRRSLLKRVFAYSQVSPSQTLRSVHRLPPSRCQPWGTVNGAARDSFSRTAAKCSSGVLFYYRLVMSSTIRERIYDNLILFTRMLHKQSNVYLCLRLRRLTQMGTLYRRIYSPHEFKNRFLDRILDRLKHFASLLQRSSHLELLYRHRILLSFASVGLFSWDENRITDDELQDLMKEFMSVENTQEKSPNEDQHESYGTPDRPNNGDIAKPQQETSFMVVNCLHATKKSEKWEEVINQPNFHVWRKSVNNSSLYEYKVFGSFFDISAYSFFTVQRDLQFRKEWDKLVLKLDVIGSEPNCSISRANANVDDSGNELVHWIMKYPYPMRSREYLFIRRSRIDFQNKFIILVARSVFYPDIPECDEHVRVYDYMSQMVIRPHQDNFDEFGFDYMLTYFDDPRASFPSPAYNWMASRGVPDFVEKLHQAALSLTADKQPCTPTPEEEPIIKPGNTMISTRQVDLTNSQTGSEVKDASSILNTSKMPNEDKQRTLTSNPQLPAPNNGVNFDRNQKSKNNETSTFSFKYLNIWS